MKAYTYTLGGEDCDIFFPETDDDFAEFARWWAAERGVMGLDTETTGLDIYSAGHGVRLVQIGSARTAWVINVERDDYRERLGPMLRQGDKRYACHNAAYDLLVLDRHGLVSLEDIAGRVIDTRIYGHLLDPRTKYEGGTGLRLKELSDVYVDNTAPDTEKGLYEVFRRDYKATKSTGWALIDVDHPVYVLYAGLDALFAARLAVTLGEMIDEAGMRALADFEHALADCLMVMQRRGVKVDVPYAEGLRDRLLGEAETYRATAARYGVENINATSQVSAALVAMGEDLSERTASGALKVDKGVLLPLADLDPYWNRLDTRTPNPLADAVVRAKRAERWADTYAGAFVEQRDSADRIHAMIGGLQARTARMSISNPPLQQLPSSDWTVRRALVADPGHLMVASDYAQVEMRVLAALSRDRRLIKAIQDGVDLHSYTAELVYGPDFNPQHRKLMKGVGFGKVYGGGATTLARQTGAPIAQVRGAIKAYDRTYPGIKRYSRKLQDRADFGKREVVTPSGRHLPLDRDRLYAATNYVVQSTARDIIAQAILRIFDGGLGDGLLLPVHDELVAQAPASDAEDYVKELGRLMDMDFYGVPIVSDPEVLGASWGHGYGAPR